MRLLRARGGLVDAGVDRRSNRPQGAGPAAGEAVECGGARVLDRQVDDELLVVVGGQAEHLVRQLYLPPPPAGGRCAPPRSVAGWFVEQAKRHGEFKVDLIDLTDVGLPLALPSTPPALQPDLPPPRAYLPFKVMLVRADHLWFPEPMTVLVTRRHVDYVRVTTTGCSAVS